MLMNEYAIIVVSKFCFRKKKLSVNSKIQY